MADESKSSVPISLPKGGGTIRGIGETFEPNLFSGTGNFSIPIATSPGRTGFGPQLSLQYSTGNGNGPFGMGWRLSVPRVTRKTEKGLPTYTDADVFVISGTEDLVPYLEPATTAEGGWVPVQSVQGGFSVELYRPRTEGASARIERWTDGGEVHWRATTRENVTSIYGRTPQARIVDPDDGTRVYEWLLEETFDARGNHIAYEYVHDEPPVGAENPRHGTQTYIRRILYGNTPDDLDPARRTGPGRIVTDHEDPLHTRQRHYLFQVLFDYGDLPLSPQIPDGLDHSLEVTIPAGWPMRPDAFSSFRSGFEIRTMRRCERVLMLHHFAEGDLDGAPLVKSTDFTYSVNADTQMSFLSDVTLRGYRKDTADPARYLMRAMPPLSFRYSEFAPGEQRFRSIEVSGGDFPPEAVDAPDFAFMDIFGNGLPDVVASTPAGFQYWENLGEGRFDRRHPAHGDQPALSLAASNVSLGDMGGDGLADLLVDAPPMSGFYESTPEGGWTRFTRFETTPSFDLNDPNTRLVDLTGDGLSDVLVTRDHHFLWFQSLGERGYAPPRAIPRRHDLAEFPNVYFDDLAGRVRLADMTGDGLTDIVLVHDGRVDYWPSLGHGRFGRRITMTGTPRIGHGFDPRRMFLADLDGTGCADLVYVERNDVRFWFNQSGNGWSGEHVIKGTPVVTDATSIRFADVFGTGTATLVWSYAWGQQPGGTNYKALEFSGGRKPHLLVEMNNNMGATTRVRYAPSTRFYLSDRAEGLRWITALPFPVQVLEKSEVIDHVSRTKLVTTYRYHHGYFDGREREFRGFGRVDQFDTETFGEFSESGLDDEAQFDNGQRGFHVPPVETRTWFHTGVYFDTERNIDHAELTERYGNEYYSGDPDAFTPPPPYVFPNRWRRRSGRHAARGVPGSSRRSPPDRSVRP